MWRQVGPVDRDLREIKGRERGTKKLMSITGDIIIHSDSPYHNAIYCYKKDNELLLALHIIPQYCYQVIILPLFYVHSLKGAPQGLKQLLSFSKQIRGIPAFYMLAVALYLLPNLLAQLFCFSSQC